MLVYFQTGCSNCFLQPPAGKDERKEQTCASPAGYHQGERDEGGREDQRGDPGVEPDQHQTLGCLAQELHPGEFLMERLKVNSISVLSVPVYFLYKQRECCVKNDI